MLDISYDLEGRGFEKIPDNAIGIEARSNENQLEYLNTSNQQLLMNITSKTSTTMTLEQAERGSHIVPFYLGAIVSADRTKVYWVNDTNPLP